MNPVSATSYQTQFNLQNISETQPIHRVSRSAIPAAAAGASTERGMISGFFYWIVQSVKGFLLSWRSAEYFEKLDPVSYRSISPIQMRWLSPKQMDGILASEHGLKVLTLEHWKEAGTTKLASLGTSSLRKLGAKIPFSMLKDVLGNRDYNKFGDKFDLFMGFTKVLPKENLVGLYAGLYQQQKVEAFQKVPVSTKAYLWENYSWTHGGYFESKTSLLKEVEDGEQKEFIGSLSNKGMGALWDAFSAAPSYRVNKERKRWEDAFSSEQMVDIFNQSDEESTRTDLFKSFKQDQKILVLNTSSPRKLLGLVTSSGTRDDLLDLIGGSVDITLERKKELLGYFFEEIKWNSGIVDSTLKAIVERFSADQIDDYLNKSTAHNRIKVLSHLSIARLKERYDHSTEKKGFFKGLNPRRIDEFDNSLYKTYTDALISLDRLKMKESRAEREAFLSNLDPDTLLGLLKESHTASRIIEQLTAFDQILPLFKKYLKDDFLKGLQPYLLFRLYQYVKDSNDSGVLKDKFDRQMEKLSLKDLRKKYDALPPLVVERLTPILAQKEGTFTGPNAYSQEIHFKHGLQDKGEEELKAFRDFVQVYKTSKSEYKKAFKGRNKRIFIT